MSDTATVSVLVGEVEHCHGTGRLLAQAHVVLGIGGIDVQLCGVPVKRGRDNRLHVQAPAYRHWRSGLWLPAVLLDPDITSAIAAEVLSAFQGVTP